MPRQRVAARRDRLDGSAELAAAIVATLCDTGTAAAHEDPFPALPAEIADFHTQRWPIYLLEFKLSSWHR